MALRYLVTGASTGIGHATVVALAGRGATVFAGVRRAQDGEPLRSAGDVHPLLVDVTDPDAVAAAGEAVGPALDGLVNNAGIAITGPLEFMPPDALRRQLEVNAVGQLAVTQACLPALRAARGRIVNVSSIGGRVALPLYGPYSASKFALEALSDSLRRELRGSGVRVAVVEPGGTATPIWGRGLDAAEALWQAMPELAHARYGGLVEVMRGEAQKLAEHGEPPETVAATIVEALTAARPRTRYVVGRQARIQAVLARVLPDSALDALIARTLRR